MAAGRQFFRSASKFTSQFSSSGPKLARSTKTLSGNLARVQPCSSSKVLGSRDTLLLNAVKKQTSKMEMRQMQRSMAVLSLTSKVSACLNITASSDNDVVDASEDSDEVCSQPGHKQRKNRCIASYKKKTI